MTPNSKDNNSPRGTHIEKWYRDVPRSSHPLFQASQHSLAYQLIYHQCAACAPYFQVRKILHFQGLVLAEISAIKIQTFQNFRSQDPMYLKKNPLPRPYFWKPVWHRPTEKSWVPPAPGNDSPLICFHNHLYTVLNLWIDKSTKLLCSRLVEHRICINVTIVLKLAQKVNNFLWPRACWRCRLCQMTPCHDLLKIFYTQTLLSAEDIYTQTLLSAEDIIYSNPAICWRYL